MRSGGQYGEDRVRPPHPPACGAAPPGWSQPGTAEEPTPDHLRPFSASTYLLLPKRFPPALAGSPPPRSPALTPAPPCNVQQLTRPQTEASPNQGPPSLPQAYIPLICPHYRQTNQGKVCLCTSLPSTWAQCHPEWPVSPPTHGANDPSLQSFPGLVPCPSPSPVAPSKGSFCNLHKSTNQASRKHL